jgi:serine/threonine-protein kinase RsbW
MSAEIRRLTVPGRYDSIPQITHFVSEAAAAAGLTEKENFHCQMSVDEACTNVIEHAYEGEGHGDIQITCTFGEGRFRIEIEDTGKPFNPDDIPRPRVIETVDDLEPGGIGLHLMHQLMDEVSFEFREGHNLLIMIKHHTPSEAAVTNGLLTTVQLDSGIIIAAPSGRINSAAAPELESGLRALIDGGQHWVAVDMEAVEYISSRGLKAFVNVWKLARAAGGDVVFGAMVPTVYETFDVVGFTQIFDIFASITLAVEALEKRSAS